MHNILLSLSSKKKDKAIEVFKLYKKEVENKLSPKVEAIRSDRGGEYDPPFEQFCS